MKDYYVVLGVARDDPPERIRDAFRELAKRFHPDVSGTADAATFREITEAYETLSDAERRARYDRTLGDLPRRADPSPQGRLRTVEPPVEPLSSPGTAVVRWSWWSGPWGPHPCWGVSGSRPRRLVRIPVRIED